MTDATYRLAVLAFCVLFQALSFGLVFYGFAVMLVPFAEDFGKGRGELMLAIVFLQVGIGVASAVLGRYIDRWPAHKVVFSGGGFLAAGFVLCALGGSYSVLLLAYGLLFPVGLVMAGSLTAQALAVRWYPDRRGFALGMVAMGTSVGGLLMPPLLAVMTASLGWQATFFALSVACFVLVSPPAWLLLRRPVPVAVAPGGGGSASAAAPVWTAASVLKRPLFWVCVAGFSPVIAAFTAIQMNIAAFASDQGIAAAGAASLLSVSALAMMAGKLFFASLSDRVSHGLLFAGVALGHVAVVVLLRTEQEFTGLALVMALFGFSVGGVLPLAGAFIAQAFGPASFGLAMGLLTPFVTASSALGPLYAGYAYDTSGSYLNAFSQFIYLLIPATVVVLMYFGVRPPQRS